MGDAPQIGQVLPVPVTEGGLIMTDDAKSKAHLIRELDELRQQIAQLEKRAEKRTADLEEANARLRGLLDNLPDYVVIVDREGIIHFLNRPQPNGSIEQLIGQRYLDYAPAEDQPRWRELLHMAFQGTEIQSYEAMDRDGVLYAARLVPLVEDGAVRNIMVIATDVTERKRAEQLTLAQRDLSVALNRVSDLREALRLCVDTALTVSAMDCGGGYLRDDEGHLDLVVHEGASRSFAEKILHIGPDSALMEFDAYGQPAYLRVSDLREPDHSNFASEGLRALAAVPVVHNGKEIALLAMASRSLDEVPIAAQTALETIAAKIGGAIARIIAEERLRESEERFRELAKTRGVIAWSRLLDGSQMLYINPEAETVFGRPCQQFFDNPKLWMKVIHPEDRERVEESARQLQNHAYSELEFRIVRPGGEVRWLLDRTRVIADEHGRPVAVGGIAVDITERNKAEHELRRERELLKKVLSLQEQERKLLTFEVHDGFVQHVNAAHMHVEASRARQLDGSPKAIEPLDEGLKLLRQSIAEARQLMYGLRQPILDEYGVVAAIDHLICELQESEAPEIGFAPNVQFDRLASPLESAIFRTVQEALTNACRHSGSSTVQIRLSQRGDRIEVGVEDEGTGFDPKTIKGDRFGLRGIQERARLFGGHATIDTAPGKGTRIVVDLPLVEVAP